MATSDQRGPVPPYLQVAPVLTLTTLVVLRPSPPIRLAASALLLYINYRIVADYATHDALQDYGAGCVQGTMAVGMFAFAWLVNPFTEWRWKGEGEAPATYPLWKRVYYGACFLCNHRRIGWDSQVSNVPPPFASTRRDFLLNRALRVLQCIIYIDLGQSYVALQPLFTLQGTADFPTGIRSFVMRFLCLFMYFLKTYGGIKLQYTVLSMLCVATGLGNGNPQHWPDLFGKWSDAYTVRHFWGKTWHQLLRGYFSDGGKALVRLLGFKKGTWASSYAQLYAAFLISAFLHCWGDIAMTGSLSQVGKSAPFYILNAAAITFEDVVIGAARKFGVQGDSKWARIAGYIWVTLWFTCSLEYMVYWMIPWGVKESVTLPFSIVRTVAPDAVLPLMQASL